MNIITNSQATTQLTFDLSTLFTQLVACSQAWEQGTRYQKPLPISALRVIHGQEFMECEAMFYYIHSQKCQGYELVGVRGCCEINKDKRLMF